MWRLSCIEDHSNNDHHPGFELFEVRRISHIGGCSYFMFLSYSIYVPEPCDPHQKDQVINHLRNIKLLFSCVDYSMMTPQFVKQKSHLLHPQYNLRTLPISDYYLLLVTKWPHVKNRNLMTRMKMRKLRVKPMLRWMPPRKKLLKRNQRRKRREKNTERMMKKIL